MLNLTKTYNETAERRLQKLDFVGKERRKIILDANEQSAQKARDAAFLAGTERIDGVKKLA